MGIADRDEVKQVFKYPILEAIARRRSRRFPLGCTLPEGAMQYASHQPAVPLNDIETAILCWSGAGITGSITGDLPTKIGGSAFGTWVGRATPYPSNVHNAKLFFTNDNGTFVYDPKKATKPVEIDTEADRERIMTYYREDCIKVLDERVEFVPKALLGVMHWNTSQPGTTVFIPIIDQSEEYINFLLAIFEVEGYGYKMFDDMKGQSAGLQQWIDSGKLKGPQVPLSSFENSLMLSDLAPAYLILENIHLVAEAMGLGAVIFGGYTGQVMLGITPMSKGLGFTAQIGKDGRPNPVGLDKIYEAYCPPYYKDMNEAVDAFVDKKFGGGGSHTAEYKGAKSFKDWKTIQSDFNIPSKTSIDQVKAICTYVYETYGRFPATTDTKLLPVWLQVHHLDLDFYDKFLDKGMVTEVQRRHMQLWHK
ncbi:MAG: hypothetical protein A2Z75_02270 [Chloroflexi bacterium RBG_13_50_10]|nr:MAG: hypothetical protein A2Z75_02270 [Chloroflexi bacterium RBG_13_50_10]